MSYIVPSSCCVSQETSWLVSACKESISRLRLAESKHTTVHCSCVDASYPGSSGRPDLLFFFFFFLAADGAPGPAPSPSSYGLPILRPLKVLLTQKLLPGSAVNRHTFRLLSPVTNV